MVNRLPHGIQITGGQIRAARAFLRWTADDLAKAAKVGVMTVRRAERVDGIPNMLVNNMLAIQNALEEAGIEFTSDDAPSVRFISNKSLRRRK